MGDNQILDDDLDLLMRIGDKIDEELEKRTKLTRVVDNERKTMKEIEKLLECNDFTNRDIVKISIFLAELVLPIWEIGYPGNTYPRDSIGAAKNYLCNPTPANREIAVAASLKSKKYIMPKELDVFDISAAAARWAAEIAVATPYKFILRITNDIRFVNKEIKRGGLCLDVADECYGYISKLLEIKRSLQNKELMKRDC